MADKICGVYMIQSKIRPDRIYIGGTINMKYRFWDHKWRLRKNNHYSSQLQYHYNKYGGNDLDFIILEQYIDVVWDFIKTREQYYIDMLNPYFNVSKTAGSPATAGKKQSPEFIEKRAGRMRGVKRGAQSEEHKRNRLESRLRGGKGNGLTGKPKPQNVCEKISKTLKERSRQIRENKNK